MLRKILIALPLTALVLNVLNAQTEKGTFSVGLNASPKILNHTDKDNNRMEFHLELQGGYFLKRNWLLGSELSYTRFRSKTEGAINHESNTYRIGAFTRKYFDFGQTKLKALFGISSGYAYKNNNEVNPVSGENDFTKDGMYASGDFGLAYFIKSRTSVHLTTYVLYDFPKDKGNVSVSLLKFGITHNFGQK